MEPRYPCHPWEGYPDQNGREGSQDGRHGLYFEEVRRSDGQRKTGQKDLGFNDRYRLLYSPVIAWGSSGL